MKKAIGMFCLCFVFFGALSSTNATVPQLIPVQGVLTDSVGTPIDGLTQITFSIYDTATDVSPHWTDTYTGGTAVDVQDGFFTVYLGELANPLTLDLAAPEQWLGITVGTDAEMPRIRLASVPFALESQVCRQLGAIDESDADSLADLIDTGCLDGFYLQGFDGAGDLICEADQTGAGGTITSVTGTAPITASTAGGAVTVGVTTGTASGTVAAGDHNHEHGALGGLADDDHTQYFSLSQNEIVTGVPQFNGGDTSTSVPPFYVDSATWVQNLNADLLDGYSSEDFALYGDLTSHNHDAAYVNVTGDTMSGTLTCSTGTSTAISATTTTASAITASNTGAFYTIFASNSNTATAGMAVYAQNSSPTGYGVYGTATSASGVNYGVYGTTASTTTGWAGYFNGRTYAGSLRVGGNNFNAARTFRYQVDATEIANYASLYGIPFTLNDYSTSPFYPGWSVTIGDNTSDMAIPIHIPYNATMRITGFECRVWQYTAAAVTVALLSDPNVAVFTTLTSATTGAWTPLEAYAPADFAAFAPNASYGAKLVISYTGAGTIDPLRWIFCNVYYTMPGFE